MENKKTTKIAVCSRGGGGIMHNTSKRFTSLVALGLSTLLPSLALSAEGNEALEQLLASAPQSPSDSKVKSVEDYSPVADLRSSRAVSNDGSIFNSNPVVITQDTVIGSKDKRWNVTTDSMTTKASKNITISNNAVLEMYATNNAGFGYLFAGGWKSLTWSGGTIKIDFLAGGWGGGNSPRGGLGAFGNNLFTINSNLDFTYTENEKGSGWRPDAVSAVGTDSGGVLKLLGNRVKIHAIGDQSQNRNNGIFALMAHSNGAIYLNAKDDGSINNQNALTQVEGSISTGSTATGAGSGQIYAHFAGNPSYLKGNIYAGLYDGSSKMNISFSSGSSMTGDIDVQGNGNHTITFDQASFIGSVKNSGTNGAASKGINTTITFKNTAGRTFGDGKNDIVASTFKGAINGYFDVSQSSTTNIIGGSNGDKGFQGSGTNNLTFDFRGNAKSGLKSNVQKQFTIGGGNANSTYTLNAFTKKDESELDLSSLSSSNRDSTNTLFSKIKDAGINIQTTNGTKLQGTLLFTNTNIKVNNNSGGDNALFAKAENINTGFQSSNGLTLGAMFGNASWDDKNKDGYITQDEITANSGGANFKLSNGESPSGDTSNGKDDKTSTGNIGKANDNIKKRIGFIFADGTAEKGYVFGGEKQGYSGTIAGGTNDSKYYFANAGYLNRSQIEDAQGDLVLFNTAFRGDLGVKNKNVSIFLDFSGDRNGLRGEQENSYANIVGSGSKNITFNFTGNTKKEKYGGAVVGDASKANTTPTPPSSSSSPTTDSDTATYTMLNLKKYDSDNTISANNGMLTVTNTNRNTGTKTLIDAIQGAGLTGFNDPNKNNLKNHYGNGTVSSRTESKDTETNIEEFSKSATTLSLRGTSLDTTNITFNDYKYDLAFGTGMGTIEGITIENSKLKGNIDLSSNSNKGHKIMMKGDSIEGDSVEIKFKDNQSNFGSDNGGGYFYYDDSTATRSSTPKTLKLSGLKQTNFLRAGSALKFSNTNLEGDLWASNNTAISLNFTGGRTWKMDNSGMFLGSGSNLVVHGKIEKLNQTQNRAGEAASTAPTLSIYTSKDQGNIELINTGAMLKWNLGQVPSPDYRLGKSFNLRGTSLKVTYSNNNVSNGSLNGIHGKVDSGSFNLVFAKGSNLETTVTKTSDSKKAGETGNYKITDEGLEKLDQYKGTYSSSGYTGNYIAESYGDFKRVNIKSKFNMTFIGENSHNINNFQKSENYSNGSTMTFVNASNGSASTNGLSNGALDGKYIGNFFENAAGTATITLEGTSLKGAELIKGNNSSRLNFKMTFVKEETAATNLVSSGTSTTSTDSTYVNSSKYANLATTTANGALKDSILKVAQSSLKGGVDFKDSNFDVLFVGNKAQELDGSGTNGSAKVFKGGSASSIVTFRDSDLNAGNGTSSLQNIKGTIAFDLSHQNEEMKITGTLSNMFGTNGNSGSNDSYNGTGKYQTKFSNTTINKLVFVKLDDANQSSTLESLKTNGLYFNDLDTFGDLSKNDYSALGKIKDANKNNNSDLIFAGNTIALKGANQEIFFIGKDSHGFDDNGTAGGSGGSRTNNTASKLGDSSGSTLTFIDAGELKVENLVNASNAVGANGGGNTQQGKGTINLIGSTRIELKDLNGAGGGVGAAAQAATYAQGAGASTSNMKTLTLASTQASGGAGVSGTGGVPGVGTPAVAVSGVAGAGTPTLAITGEGITINAVFTGANALVSNDSSKQRIKGESTTDAEDLKDGNFYASDVHIGQAGERTTYHILFDYTDALGDKDKKGFGKYHTYLGNIKGLEADSIIKFKNAGYINEEQIKGTKATIFLDNTQLKGDFRGDVAVLDFRENSPAISGSILTSDTKESNPVLSRKLLTFDLTNSTKDLNFSGVIQAGYKIAPEYTQDGQSILTFQNAPTLNLGAKAATQASDSSNGTANSSSFIQALATDAGFSGIKNAKTTADGFGTAAAGRDANSNNKQAYILSGTKLAFEGTNITANGDNKAIKEDLYELDLSFDNRADGSRGQTGLGETLGKSILTANSITMGEAKTNSGSTSSSGRGANDANKNPLGLSLAFYDKGSLVGDSSKANISNVLEVKLKDNARFNLVAQSSNGNIGTLVLAKNKATEVNQLANQDTALKLSKDSSLSIGAGSMSFIGSFIQADASASTPSAPQPQAPASPGARTVTPGNINASFNGENKVYGTLKGYGEMNIALSGDALFDFNNQRSNNDYTWAKPDETYKDAQVLIDASSATKSNITLEHTSGNVWVKGKTIQNGGPSVKSTSSDSSPVTQDYTNLSLNNAKSHIALEGSFTLNNPNVSFTQEDKTMTLTGNTLLRMDSGSLTLADKGVVLKYPENSVATAGTPASNNAKTLYITALGSGERTNVNLTLTNLDSNLTVSLTPTQGATHINLWGNQGTWNFRGTNIKLDTAFWAENNSSQKKMIFAKGEGREVLRDPATPQSRAETTSCLTLDQLTGADKINQSTLTGELKTASTDNNNKNATNLILKNGELTFIGKEAFGIDGTKAKIDGTQGKINFGFYNSLIKAGNVIFDNNSNGAHNNLGKNANIQDVITLSGTDTFNLSVKKSEATDSNKGLNNSTITAVFVNGDNLKKNTQANAQTMRAGGGAGAGAEANTTLTGKTYIDADNAADDALKLTLSQYATSNAGGALSQSILKTLQSRAYGNITLENTVTATMKFIGDGSHSFDGKIAVSKGTDSKYGIADDEIYYSKEASTTDGTKWHQLKEESGVISTDPSKNMNQTAFRDKTTLATLSGGNANSKFYFDHTSVKLDLIKNAGGRTYVYNSTILGEIAVNGTTNNGGSQGGSSSGTALKPNQIAPSTTLFFNAKMDRNVGEEAKPASRDQSSDAQQLTKVAETFITSQFKDALGINLDLKTAHELKEENLSSSTSGSTGPGNTGPGSTGTATKKLGQTSKQTNIVLIGKKAFKKNGTTAPGSRGTTGDAIDLTFLPDNGHSNNYAYTIISGGIIDASDLERVSSDYELHATIFGNSKVQLVDTYIKGKRNFAQVGFINTNQEYNQYSSWGGENNITQYLIFDMGGSKANKLNTDGNTDVITNKSTSSRYIFSNLNTKDPVEFKSNIKQTVNEAMSNIAPSTKQIIGNDVKGYLGFRGVSIKGDIEGDANNGIDLVFNSTSATDASQGIAYKEWFDSDGNHHSEIIKGEKNLVSHGTDYQTEPTISGYAILQAKDENGIVTIKGNASKDITFIGKDSVQGGFDKLKIQDGTMQSNYTFHSVGTLSQTFLDNVGLHKSQVAGAEAGGGAGTPTADMKATKGNFSFIDSSIIGDINGDANPASTGSAGSSGSGSGAQGSGSSGSAGRAADASAQSAENVLTFENVDYSGNISGTLKKNLKFGANTDNVSIKEGSDASVYDFSALSGKSIHLDIDFKNSTSQYHISKIKGFDGDTSLVGSLNLALSVNETTDSNSDYSNSFAFNNDAKWTVTDHSRVMNLSLSNSQENFNLDLSSAPRKPEATQVADQAQADAQAKVNRDLRVLEVGTLTSNNGQVLLGTQIDKSEQSKSKSDKIKASLLSSGTLQVSVKDTLLTSGKFDTTGDQAIVLVTADTSYGEVKGAQRKEGLSYVITNLEHQVSENSTDANWTKVENESSQNTANKAHRWVLSSFDSKVNQELVDESGFIVSNPYRMLMIESNNLNKRMGDLRDNDYSQGAWIRIFNGMDNGEGIKNLYTNIQLGYDYATPAIGAKNYSGAAFSTSIVDIDGNQYSGKSNTYSLALYNAYIADSGLYVDTIAKYLYTDQKLSPTGSTDSSFGSHALSLGVEVGYRAYMGESNFYFEPQAELIGGLIFGVKDIAMGHIGGRDIVGELKTTTALNARVGVVQGYSLKTQDGFRADFRLGASLVNEFVSDKDPIRLYDGITEAGTSIGNDMKVVLNVGTNLILTDQWRVYIDAERSFGGSRNTDYQANVGARFSFGDTLKSLAKASKPLPLKLESKTQSEAVKENKTTKEQEVTKAKEGVESKSAKEVEQNKK